jgi:arabinofuranan 3-O-arabinosyltransferase
LHLGLAAVAYVPLLLTQPGWVSADTKTYFYLDPGRLLGDSWSMWDPKVGLGTVTHQRIGFLWPMAPFYWLTDVVGLPDWAAQRLWWGTIIFAAGAGVAYLVRILGWRGPGVTAAVFVYALSPFVLTLVARLSGILLPFSGLPWLLALGIQSTRHRDWRYPALFALTIATFGSVNLTALVLVALAPLLWIPYSVWGAREVPPRHALITTLKLGLLSLPVSAWWIAGLSVQSTNGIEILHYTETPKVVASTSVSFEVLRGLGYWFFYGGDRLGAWLEPSVSYTQWEPLLLVTYMVPILALCGAAAGRWRHRAFFVLLVPVGTALAVGAYPWGHNYPFGHVLQIFQGSDAGLALRSLPRAVPLVALGLAVLLGGGVGSVVRRWPRLRRPAGVGAVALALLALPPLWLGEFVPSNLRRKEEIPDYWREAGDYLDQRDDGTRVLVVPGSDFASYRWGNTVDPILPGLMSRPSVQRELAPYGSEASANLINEFDLRLQERTADPASVAAMARLMRAGDVLVVSDWQYERYKTPRPRNFWDFITRAPGLGEPTGFGPGNPNLTVPEVQLYDELYFLTDPSIPDPPEVAAFPVENPVPVVSAHPSSHPLLVAGDAMGLVDAAGAHLIDGSELIRYSAALDDEDIRAALRDDDAVLLLTDSNRKRGERWTTLWHNRGYTETADGGQLRDDLTDNRLPVFPDAGTDAQTVSVRRGRISAEATTYGNPISFTSEERPMLAVDGKPRSSWRTAAFSDGRGERLDLTMAEETTTDRVRLSQPPGAATRAITRVRLRFDDGDPLDVALTEESRKQPGQVINFGRRTFTKLSIEILADSAGYVPRYAGQTSLGLAEVEIGAVENLDNPALETVRLPTDLLDAAGADSLEHPLAVNLTRLRQDPTDPTRSDDETALVRMFELPTDRTFSVSGEARLSARTDAFMMDALLGRPHNAAVPWVRAGNEMAGSVSTPAAVFDGDPATSWSTVRSRPIDQWVEVALPQPTTIDHLPLTVVADGMHSVPTQVELWVDGVPQHRRIDIPPIIEDDRQNATADVDLPIPGGAVTGSRFRLKITKVHPKSTRDWNSGQRISQPAAIAEIGLPGPKVPALPDTFDSGCRSDLLTVNGQLFPVQITGSMADALASRPLTLTPCDPGVRDHGLTLPAGSAEITSDEGNDTGLNIDQLVLRSAAGGAASTSTDTLVQAGMAEDSSSSSVGSGHTPRVEVVHDGLNQVRVKVSGATPGQPFWLVLGQSFNSGWVAHMDGHSLPAGELVDGYANGWRIDPRTGSFEVQMEFEPQRRVNAALGVSALGTVLCLLLLIRRPRAVVLAASAAPAPFSASSAFQYSGELPTRRQAAVVALAAGLVGWMLAGPLVGVPLAVATALAARREEFRRWLLVGSVASLVIAAAYVEYISLVHSPLSSFDWPYEMRRPHPLGWLAVLLLVADVVVNRLWRPRARDGPQ